MEKMFKDLPKTFPDVIFNLNEISEKTYQKGKPGYGFMRNPSSRICVCSKLKSIKTSLALVGIAFITLGLLSGCVGMVADSMARSMVTDKPYGEMIKTVRPPAAGNGRLYIYRTAASTNYL